MFIEVGYRSDIKRNVDIEKELEEISKNENKLLGVCPVGAGGPKTTLIYLVEEKKLHLFMDYEDNLLNETPVGDKNTVFIIDFNDGAAKKIDIDSIEEVDDKFIALFHATNDYLEKGGANCKYRLNNILKMVW